MGLKLIVPAVGALLALSAALAAACFVRAFGFAFLGRPRTPEAVGAQETDTNSLVAMYVVATLCLIAGIIPASSLMRCAGGAIARRRPHAGADWRGLDVDRSDRGKP